MRQEEVGLREKGKVPSVSGVLCVSVGDADVGELGIINRYRISNKDNLNHLCMTKRFGRTPDNRIPDLFCHYEKRDRSCQGCLMEGW